MLVVEILIEFLLPSWWEVQVSVAAAAFVMVAYLCFSIGDGCGGEGDGVFVRSSPGGEVVNDAKEEVGQLKGDSQTKSAYLIKVELLAAKNLIGANLNGTSDPYAIITCGAEKCFSSMVPGSRNPIWKEEFNFSVDELPVEIIVTIYGWDIIRRSAILGSMITSVEHEGRTGATWYTLDSASGLVCLQINALKLQMDSSRVLNGYAGANTRRMALDKQGPTVVHQKQGPLQRIFNLLPDEVVQHSYSCALERSFLYHGRMYISAWHVCFHSNVFSKKMKVIIPFEDIDEIRRSQHALINPAISIILRVGFGGRGVPPLGNTDGRVRYKFASFWNRNQALRALQYAVKNYRAKLEAEKKEEQPVLLDFVKEEHSALLDPVEDKEQSALHSHSNFVRFSESQFKCPEDSLVDPKMFQPFIREEVLTKIYNDVFPCTVEQFFKILLDDYSTFTSEYHTARKDSNLIVGQWRASDDYHGLVREVTYRTLCNFPLCPPDIPVTEWQHAVLSADKKTLLFETVQQTEGVPFASYFEGHCRWSAETNSESSCTLDIRFGAYFKKWCLLQSKIKAAAVDDNRKVYKIKLDAARSHIKARSWDSEIIRESE